MGVALRIGKRIVVITNRDVHPEHEDLRLFGEDLNNPPEDLNLALAEHLPDDEGWRLELLTDPVTPNYTNPVSRKVFKQALREVRSDGSGGHWVLLVHGFNQSLEKNLKKCLEIQAYGVNVATFSWPSNPGPHQLWKKGKEYRRARQNARRSALALERALEKLATYLNELTDGTCPIHLTLVVHSLGNYLFENFVKGSDFSQETRVFSNIVLHQADADNRGHAQWVERVSGDTRVYVTINERDQVLGMSEKVNPDRLGRTVRNLDADGVVYMDFTNGLHVGDSHRPWARPGTRNRAIGAFYNAVFRGQRGERAVGWVYDANCNAYRLVEQEEWEPAE